MASTSSSSPKPPLHPVYGVGRIEGLSYLLLVLVGMPLKYWAGLPAPNRIIGTLHGILFVGYVITLVQAWRQDKWPLRDVLYGFLASLLPIGPYVFERWHQKQVRARVGA